MKATVITDASFCDKAKVGGWAAWVAMDGRRIQRSGPFRHPVSTSSLAEARAIANGIHLAVRAGATSILVQSDCKQWTDWLAHPQKHQRFWQSVGITAPAGVSIDARHVRGHTAIDDARSYCNRWCDQNAKQHMRKARGK